MSNLCLTHYEMLENAIAKLESERDEAVDIIEDLNRLACAAMIDANRDGHEYDITAELKEARAFLARMEVKE